MKICLINPPILSEPGLSKTEEIFQPLGLAYLGGVLEKNGYEVIILDAVVEDYKKKNWNGHELLGLDYNKISEFVIKEKPSIVGISVPFSAHYPSALKVAKAVKENTKDVITVLGGPHVSVVPEKCMSQYVDFLVIGEGEITFLYIADYLKNSKQKDIFKEIQGIAFRLNGKTIKTEPRPFIDNLDELPFPARHLLPMEKYFKFQKNLNYGRLAPERTVSVITSRGCPFGCVFCSIALTLGKKFRHRSPQNVVDEIESLIRDYDIKSIEFEDDNLTFDIKRANDIFDEVLKRKLKFKWRAPNGIRADLLDSETIKKFKDAGCYELWFAPESGSQRVVNEVIGKRLSLSRVDAAIKECLMNGITVNCFLVIGLPGETKKEIEETLSYMKKLRKMGVGCYINIATPLYGTKLHRIATEKKYLRPIKDSNMLYNNGLYLDTPDFSAEEVYNYFKIGRKIQKKIVFNKEFVLFLFTNHRRIVHHIVKKIAKMSSRPNG